ncbi:putative membrane protein [Agromyces sp. PvR057]
MLIPNRRAASLSAVARGVGADVTRTVAAAEDSASIRRVVRSPAANVSSLESAALLVGSAFFVVGALVGLFAFWGQSLPISGRGSLGAFAGVGGAIAAVLAFVLGRYLADRTPNPALRREIGQGLSVPGARLHWFDIASLAIAHGVIALLGWLALSTVLELSFTDAVVFALPAAALGGVALALTAYVSFLSAARMTPMLLSLVLAVFLVVGAFASMLSASDPHWWEENLSALGMTDDLSAKAFNLTLIIAGAIVTIVARYATATLPASTPPDRRGRDIVRFGLILIGIFLACVGIFPVDEFFAIHNTVATGMAVCFAVIVLGLPRFIRTVPRVFVVLGYVYVAVIIVVAVFFATGYYNLTAVELVAGCLIFSWIIVFLRTAGATGDPEAEPAVLPSVG